MMKGYGAKGGAKGGFAAKGGFGGKGGYGKKGFMDWDGYGDDGYGDDGFDAYADDGYGMKGYGMKGGMKGGKKGAAGPYGGKGGAAGGAGNGASKLTPPAGAIAGYGRLTLGVNPAAAQKRAAGLAMAQARIASMAPVQSVHSGASPKTTTNPTFYWASVDPASQLPADAYTTDGPAVVYDKQCNVFSSAKHIIQEIFSSDFESHVKIVHDTELDQFPEIMEAIKAQGHPEDSCIAVAMYPAKAKWAVGVGNGWQARERAVFIATGLVVAMSQPKLRQKLCRVYPDFGSLMDEVLALTGNMDDEVEDEPLTGAGEASVAKTAQVKATPTGMGPNPELYWASVDAASQLPADAYTTDGPCVVYDKSKAIFSSAKHLLQDIFSSDVASHVKIVHDTELDQFPEVMEAIKAQGYPDDECIAVAMYPEKAKWAVGVGSGWQGRERAVYVATALVVAMSRPKLRQRLSRSYPAFGTLMEELLSKCGDVEEEEAADGPLTSVPMAADPKVVTAGDGSEIKQVSIPATAPLVGDGYSTEGFALSHTKSVDAFSHSAFILGELLGDDISEKVQFTHDVDWTAFPEIAAGLAADPTPQNCMCVATCPEHAKWGVGLAGNWKPRESAAKLALAMAIAQGTDAAETLKQNHPSFATFVGDLM